MPLLTSQPLLNCLPHDADRKLHTGGMTAATAIAIDAAFEVVSLNDQVDHSEWAVASRRRWAKECDNRSPGSRGQMHWSCIPSDKQPGASREQVELLKRYLE